MNIFGEFRCHVDATPYQRQLIRDLYQYACFGAGAETRWEARDKLDAHALALGRGTTDLLIDMGLDIHAYAATRPISRPQKET